MILSDIILFILLSVSVAQMWNYSKIFLPVRNLIAKSSFLSKPLLCMECSSFWVGVLTSLFYNPLRGEFTFLVATMFAGLLTHLVASYLLRLYIKLT